MRTRTLVLTSLSVLVLHAAARADYPTEQMKLKLGQIERAMDAFERPDWFDGKRIAAGTSASAVENRVYNCNYATSRFTALWPEINDNVRNTDQGRNVQRRHGELVPVCKALGDAAEIFNRDLAAAEARAGEARAAEQAAEARRMAFYADIPPPAMTFLVNFRATYDESLTSFQSADYGDDAYRTARAGYEALLPVCKKHAPLTNPPAENGSRNIAHRPLDACTMAQQGAALVQKRREHQALDPLRDEIEHDILRSGRMFMAGQPPTMPELLQIVVFDPKAFAELMDKKYIPKITKVGGTMPAGAYDRAFTMNDEIKAKIEADVQTNAAALPKFHDAGAEKAAKAAFTRAIKGVKIRKVATHHKRWAQYDERTWVRSDETYDYYRVNAGKTKYMSGVVLLEIPGRPHCQLREWSAFRVRSGPIKVVENEASASGLFVKCP